MDLASALWTRHGEYLDRLVVKDGPSVIVEEIQVKLEFRGFGIGTRIITDITNYADDEQKIIFADVQNCTEIKKFFLRHGFVGGIRNPDVLYRFP